MSLFDQLGGEPGIDVIVGDFYERISSDGALAPWFERANGEGIRFHLRAYLAVALGGPEGYTGRSMRQAHAGLRITGAAFDVVLRRFTESLHAAGVEEPLVTRARAVVASLRPVVVTARTV